MTFEGKRYLGKSAEHVSIRHNGGPMTAGEWLTRESPVAIRDGILVHQRSALTYANIATGDQVTDSMGQRWVVIEVPVVVERRTVPTFRRATGRSCLSISIRFSLRPPEIRCVALWLVSPRFSTLCGPQLLQSC